MTSVNLQGMDLFFLALSDLVVKQLPSTLFGCTRCILLKITSSSAVISQQPGRACFAHSVVLS